MQSNHLLFLFLLLLNYMMIATIFGPLGIIYQTLGESTTHSNTINNLGKCQDINTYDLDHVKNEPQVKTINSKSISIDLGCDKPISTIDIIWKNSSLTAYNYTLTILSESQTSGKNFSYTSSILPENTTQTAGTKNTIGNLIILTISKSTNTNILGAVETISIHTSIPRLQKTMSDGGLWNETSNSHPSNLSIGTSKEMVHSNIFRITDGDNIDIINPYYIPSKILNVSKQFSFHVMIPFEPIEGIAATIESNKISISLESLNNTINWDLLSKGDKIYFGTQLDVLKETDNSANLTIMLASSSETSLYFKSPIHLTG